jgi:uncharacterized protein YjiK
VTTTSKRCSRISIWVTGLLLCGCSSADNTFQTGGYRYNTNQFEQWKLPSSLREISGLGQTADGRLFAHADEHAVIHQIDYQTGKRLKSFALSHKTGSGSISKKAVKGDFEGMAVVDDRIHLITSRGLLYTSQLGADGSAVPFHVHQTGTGDSCEIEGLAYHRELHVLLLACKVVHAPKLRGQVVVFQWSMDSQAIIADATIRISLAAIQSELPQLQSFNPSALAVSPRNGNLILVGARQQAIVEATMSGKVANVFSLPMQRYHPQTEGIALFADGTLILADEGGNKRGRIGVYRTIN